MQKNFVQATVIMSKKRSINILVPHLLLKYPSLLAIFELELLSFAAAVK